MTNLTHSPDASATTELDPVTFSEEIMEVLRRYEEEWSEHPADDAEIRSVRLEIVFRFSYQAAKDYCMERYDGAGSYYGDGGAGERRLASDAHAIVGEPWFKAITEPLAGKIFDMYMERRSILAGVQCAMTAGMS